MLATYFKGAEVAIKLAGIERLMKCYCGYVPARLKQATDSERLDQWITRANQVGNFSEQVLKHLASTHMPHDAALVGKGLGEAIGTIGKVFDAAMVLKAAGEMALDPTKDPDELLVSLASAAVAYVPVTAVPIIGAMLVAGAELWKMQIASEADDFSRLRNERGCDMLERRHKLLSEQLRKLDKEFENDFWEAEFSTKQRKGREKELRDLIRAADPSRRGTSND